MNIHIVIGTRPQYVKLAALYPILKQKFNVTVIDTGQHYDYQMSGVLLRDLKLPSADINLKVGSGGHGVITGMMLGRLEKVWLKKPPDLVIVFGDTNSCLAGALTAAKLGIPVAHIEAGLRSFEDNLPEEINRKIVDHLSSLLFTTEPVASINLIREGISQSKIFYVGNIMIDSLNRFLKIAKKRRVWKKYGLLPRNYSILTLHRPENVDDPNKLDYILKSVVEGAANLPIIFPVHLRTKKYLNGINLFKKEIKEIKPLGYLDFISLMCQSKIIITDSGGIQEESSALGIPCVTLRETTERPITVDKGTNVLAGTKRETIILLIEKAKKRKICPVKIPKWDGKASLRIISALSKWEKERNNYG